MHSATLILLVLSSLVAASLGADPIKCYHCADCPDPWDEDASTVDSKACLQADLWCFRKTTGSVITKGCMINPDPDNISNGDCKDSICYCDNDECNGADVNKVASFTVMALAVVAAKFFN